MRRHAFLLSLVLVAAGAAAQTPATGFPPYGSFEAGQFDAVNRQNLNVNFAIPVVASHGRGMNLRFAVIYDSLIWQKSATAWLPATDQSGAGTWGWKDAVVGEIRYKTMTRWCFPQEIEVPRYSGYAYVDPAGTRHAFSLQFYEENPCNFTPTGPRTGYATDGSGYYMDASDPTSPYVLTPAGMRINFDGTLTDTNGNFFSKVVVSATETHWKDTAGRIAVKIKKFTGSTDCGTGYAECIRYEYSDTSGATQTITLKLKSYNIETKFLCAGVSDYNQNDKNLPDVILLPNGRSYSFEYEATPGDALKTTGRLKKVTLPTGGSYEYLYPATPNNGINCDDGSVLEMARVINDGTTPLPTWTYARSLISGSTWKTKVTAPLPLYDTAASESTFTFSFTQLLSEKYYQGSEAAGTLLQTIDTTWAANGTPFSRTVILEDTPGPTKQQSKTETDFDTYGNLLELREFDWGSGAPGALVRRTTNTYLATSDYTIRNIRNRVTEAVVRDGAGAVKSKTGIAYDGYPTPPFSGANCITGSAQHDDTNYGCTFTARGNPTSVTTYTDPATPSGPVTQTSVYDSLGNVRSVTDPGGHTTNLSYADNYSDGVNRNSYAYLTQLTKAVPFSPQALNFKYFYPTGQLQSATDENSRVTSFEYADAMNRATRTAFPDGGETTIVYNDVSRRVTTTQKRTGTQSVATTDVYNQIGLLVQRQLPGGRNVDVAYDPLGRVWKVSNPYVSTGDPTYGQVETRYDALGRVTRVVNQDGTFVQTEYAGNATRVTDETSNQKLKETDALGRATKVCEVTAGNTRSPAESCGITPFGGGTGYLTTNTYDVLDNLTQVAQGAQTRISNYDGLSRMTSARIVEVSTTANVTYGYDNDSLRTSVTDPRGTVNFEYDELHRLRKKKHGTTVVAEFVYDGTQANNAIGRLIAEWDGPAGTGDKTEYTYDTMGRVLTANRTASGTTYAMAYTYDFLGGLTSLNYPSSAGTRRLVEYSYNAAAELDKVTDATNPAARFDYVSSSADAPTVYSPLGTLARITFGNDVRTTVGWNNTQRLTSLLTQKVGGSTHLNLAYTYYDNGQVFQITDALSNLKDETYTYDSLRRLLAAQRGPDVSIQRKYEYDYDRYGNRWEQTVVAGSGYPGSFSFDMTRNRVTSLDFTYDGSGNLTANGPGTSYTYNPENFMTAAGTITYLYDAQGRRVRKTVGGTVTDYFYSGSEVISEKQGSGWTDYIFFGDRIAQQTGSTHSTATYLHTDPLRSTRVCTDASGASNGRCDYEPFGEFQDVTACSALPTRYRFAGMAWDSEISGHGFYHTWFRQYDPAQGRWMSVDPLAGSPDDPQSLNRYAYVVNDPINLIDPLGLWPILCIRAIIGSSPEGGFYLIGLIVGRCGSSPGGPIIIFEGPGGDRPAPQPPRGPCPPVPPAPPGSDIKKNIATAEAERRASQSAANLADLPSARAGNTLAHYAWFASMVGNRRPWDYKRQGPQYRDFGNFNYGATGLAAGFTEDILLRAAGYAQRRARTSRPEWGHPLGRPPYGDDPLDQAVIKKGFDYYRNDCYK